MENYNICKIQINFLKSQILFLEIIAHWRFGAVVVNIERKKVVIQDDFKSNSIWSIGFHQIRLGNRFPYLLKIVRKIETIYLM